MCLAVCGEILTISEAPPRAVSPPVAGPGRGAATDPLWRVAEVDFGGVRQQVSLACLPEARVGDRVLVHVGFALSLVEEEQDGPSVELPDGAWGRRG